MPNDFDDENVIWRKCERAWAGWLGARVTMVVPLADISNNAPDIKAPMIRVEGQFVRAPDLMATNGNQTEYWEVKYRSRASVYAHTGDREHWMSFDCAADYLHIQSKSQIPVWIILYEAEANNGRGQWLQIDIAKVWSTGRAETKFAAGYDKVQAWCWPRSSMTPVDGPSLDIANDDRLLLPDEGIDVPVDPKLVISVQRKLRRTKLASRNVDENEEYKALIDANSETARVVQGIEEEARIGLDALSARLGLPVSPKYSVLRFGDLPGGNDGVLEFLDYGIRVFLVTTNEDTGVDPLNLSAFQDSRLLEWAVVPEALGLHEWIVDGNGLSDISEAVQKAKVAADESGKINMKQYDIVHSDAKNDIMVSAGAGTGKTETMSERVVFLLATHASVGNDNATDLRLDDIVLVTFTKEAARQMRERLVRTLALRRRLCPSCVMPALAWMMQLSSTQICTIHSYAKFLAKDSAGVLGLSPSFRVSAQTMDFRRALYDKISPRLEELFAHGDPASVPPAHEWQKFIDEVWNKLESNGIDLMPLLPSGTTSVDWPKGPAGSMSGRVVDVVTKIINEIGQEYADLCAQNQALPTNKLVATALASLNGQTNPSIKRPRWLFVDEFQDTDFEQMELLTTIRTNFGARLFVVGDIKQAIYRFRGAGTGGSAFGELELRLSAEEKKSGLKYDLKKYNLVRNFRSGKPLLDSLHPFFKKWASPKLALLEYKDSDRLTADVAKSHLGAKIRIDDSSHGKYVTATVNQIKNWQKGDGKTKSIAILCRQNWTAKKIQKAVRDQGISCDLVVGGDFFRVPAVRELRVLIEAVANPADNAALLELCETRWFEGILTATAVDPFIQSEEENAIWRRPDTDFEFLAWRDRFATLKNGSIDVADLENFRARIYSLKKLTEKMPLLSWLVNCSQKFSPELCAFDTSQLDDDERVRYARCFDHLVTTLDQSFASGPLTIESLLFWLKLKIATDFSEDEPYPLDDTKGKVLALTVHKAKGLEFDRVIIPYTWEPIVKGKRPREIAIIAQPSGRPKIIWKWRVKESGKEIETENAPFDPLWKDEEEEQRKEETRLLYVALTRAIEHLVVFVKPPPKNASTSPAVNSWSDLIREV
jgi:DNA helicase-2/ATP-dependent DNA helicase PcrA